MTGQTDDSALIFEYDAVAELWTCSEELCDLYCIPEGQAPTTAVMIGRVMEDDRPIVLERFQRLLSGASALSFEYGLVDRNGRVRRLVLVGQSEEAGGEVKRLSGYVVDITEAIRAGATQAVSASIQHRAAIEQAKGALMLSFGVREESAFDLLRAYSNKANLKLARVADFIVKGIEAPSFPREDPVRGMLDIVAALDSEKRK